MSPATNKNTSAVGGFPIQKWIGWLLFVGILLAFAVYAWRFIRLTSFTIDGKLYYALFDDAMISMQYARNLANGHGLVWNTGGPRVEGFSNPLWVLFMAFFQRFGLPSSTVSLTIQISGAVFLVANLFIVKKIAQHFNSNWLAPLLAIGLTAFYFPLNNWSLQGMEVSALTLLLSIAVWRSLVMLQRERFSVLPYLLLATGSWVRVDMMVPLIALTSFMAWADPEQRRRHLSWGFGLLAAFFLVQTSLRYWYYGEWLPNTYYLKVVGIPLGERIRRGLGVFGQFIWGSGWTLMVLPLILLLLWPSKSTYLLFALLAGQAAYSIYVGGDAWEHKGGANRFLAIVMPLFFVLFVHALDKIRAALLQVRSNQGLKAGSQVLLGAFVFTSLFSFNYINENDARAKWMLLKRPIFVAGTQRYVTMGLVLNRITDEQASIAVATAGNIIYFSEREGIDMLGKSDTLVARSQPHPSDGVLNNVEDLFRPGHNKWDYQHSIVELQPDIVAQVWGSSVEMDPYLIEGGYEYFEVEGFPLYIRVDSPHILWEQIKSSP